MLAKVNKATKTIFLKCKINLILLTLKNIKNMGTKATTKPEPVEISAKIVNIMQPSNSRNYSGEGEGRISIVTDKEFSTIDKATGEEKTTTIFGLHSYNLVQQVAPFSEHIALASALAMGGEVNPQIIALSLRNADVTFVREYHEKGEPRETDGEVYSENCYTTKITKVTPHISPLFADTLKTLVFNAPTVIKKTSPNPFL